jgi:exodeoxyribonuclease VII large subunit
MVIRQLEARAPRDWLDRMPRQVKSQWDFGELFPTAATRRVWSVSELTAQVRRLLEREIGQVWVTGEITNLRRQNSGHVYFTLKDASAQLQCVLFRGEAVSNRELLQDGQHVIVQGEATVYEPRGQYQLRVTAVEFCGVGALQVAWEKLKQKLSAEGLFALERKRPLPRYPQRIGLVTSPTGAAIRDVLHVIQRRQPSLEIVLAPCRVQGSGAAAEVAEAVRLLNEWSALQTHPLDLILVTRGGGSLEDLWAFNEEVVAYAVFASILPVVSAVGHEIDFTICDFVADLRAATPSAAAELITEGAFAGRQFLAAAAERLEQVMQRALEMTRDDLDQLQQRLRRVHPRRRLDEKLQRLDDLRNDLLRCAENGLKVWRVRGQSIIQRLSLVKPSQILLRRREALRRLDHRLTDRSGAHLTRWRNRWTTAEARLCLLSPLNVLDRGYSITSSVATGQVIRWAKEVKAGTRLRTRLKSGEIRSVVEE